MRYRSFKRIVDVLLASLALVLAGPFLLFGAFGVLVTLGFPIVFAQDRAGLRGIPFRVFKLRTMRSDPTGLLDDNARLTRFGRFLRQTSIDELPQLWNVVRGEMSLVGPRPLLLEYLPLYDAEQARRHEVLPGLTGLAQVRGRNTLSWEERFALDVRYVDEATVALDFRILVETVGRVLSRQGIDSLSGRPMERFTGNAGRVDGQVTRAPERRVASG